MKIPDQYLWKNKYPMENQLSNWENLEMCSGNEGKLIRNVFQSQNFRLRRAKRTHELWKWLIMKLCQKSHTISSEKIYKIIDMV